MNIYLIRHGEAEPASDKKSDGERELTETGIQVLKSTILIWKNYINHFDVILSSPLKRAIQTASIVKEEFKVESEIVQENSLLNNGSTKDLLIAAESFGVQEIAMIGHQPDLGMHSATMIGSANLNIKLSPASIVKIIFKDKITIGKGLLEFFLPPNIKKG
jgi:phosphohistidine phosphatase